jgi:hypothetical protein
MFNFLIFCTDGQYADGHLAIRIGHIDLYGHNLPLNFARFTNNYCDCGRDWGHYYS